MSETETVKFERYVAQDVEYHKASIPIEEMPSCTGMFDKWAQCFALGPQLKAVYRYGSFQDCQHKMDDFKFCLTMKGMDQQDKYDAWIQRKAQHTASKRLSRESSENVWSLRQDQDSPATAHNPSTVV